MFHFKYFFHFPDLGECGCNNAEGDGTEVDAAKPGQDNLLPMKRASE